MGRGGPVCTLGSVSVFVLLARPERPPPSPQHPPPPKRTTWASYTSPLCFFCTSSSPPSVSPFIQSRMMIENLELCGFSHAGQEEIVLIKIWRQKLHGGYLTEVDEAVLLGTACRPYKTGAGLALFKFHSVFCLRRLFSFFDFLSWPFYALSHSVSIFFCLLLHNLSYVAPSPSHPPFIHVCFSPTLSSPLPPRTEVVLLRFFLFFGAVDGWRGALAVWRGGKKGQ